MSIGLSAPCAKSFVIAAQVLVLSRAKDGGFLAAAKEFLGRGSILYFVSHLNVAHDGLVQWLVGSPQVLEATHPSAFAATDIVSQVGRVKPEVISQL